MTRRFFLVAALLLSGCSLLLDPSKVEPLSCPAQPTRCSVRANATARCEGTACAWTCKDGFADVDQDLALAASTGCEAQCSQTGAPANPLAITANVGAMAGIVQLQWARPGVSARSFRLCTGAAAGFETQCLDLLASDVCVGDACKASLFALPNGVQVFARLQSIDACGTSSAEASAPRVSFAPIDATAGTGWVLDSPCNATATWNAGVLGFEQMGFYCISTLQAGAALWQDFTLDTEVRFSSVSGQTAYAGLVLRNTAQGHRLGLVLSASENSGDETVRLSRRLTAGGPDTSVAESVASVAKDTWIHLRVVSLQRSLSVSMGPDAASVVEVLRWHDALSAPTLAGQLGFALASQGRAELRGMTISTRAVMPDAGALSAQYDFATGPADGGFPDGVRVRVPAFATLEACPGYAVAADCSADAGCLPPAAARCAHLRSNLIFPAAVGMDLPVGIDTRKAWRMAFNFAATPADAGVSYPTILRGAPGNLITAPGNFSNNLQVLGQDLGRKLTPGTWNRAELKFDAEAGRFEVSLNGTAVPLTSPVFPPPNTDPHLGAFFFGKGSIGFDGWITHVELQQP